MNLYHTASGVTLCVCMLLILFKLSEQSTSPMFSKHDRMVEQILDLSDHYYRDSRAATDDVERLKLRAMALSLLTYASVIRRNDVLEHTAGYSVTRRIKHIETDLHNLRQSIVPNNA